MSAVRCGRKTDHGGSALKPSWRLRRQKVHRAEPRLHRREDLAQAQWEVEIITCIDSAFGSVAVVMIGATNVGKISVQYDTFISNNAAADRTVARDYEPPKDIKAGDRLGTFHMGSSVVVLVEPGRVDLERVRLHAGTKVQYGAAILHGE
jgi:phosphatidylserine decarboxylase